MFKELTHNVEQMQEKLKQYFSDLLLKDRLSSLGVLATGIARVRAKIKYNPVVFELMPPIFTLLQLQRCVEGIAGLNVHKPNFRRLIEQQQLVEETGEAVFDTGGRPAKAYRFRAAVREERAVAGTKVPLARS